MAIRKEVVRYASSPRVLWAHTWVCLDCRKMFQSDGPKAMGDVWFSYCPYCGASSEDPENAEEVTVGWLVHPKEANYRFGNQPKILEYLPDDLIDCKLEPYV